MQSYKWFCWSVKHKPEKASVNTDSQRSKQEACFACANQLWPAEIHDTYVTSDD